MVAIAVAVPVARAARPARIQPGQRIDLKVLLLSADGTQPGFGAWKAELDREGVPYDAVQIYNGQTRVAPTLDDAFFADYGANHAQYSAVILETGDLGHTVTNPGGTTSFLSALGDTEWAALAKFERTFGIRQLSDATFPSPLHGLNPVGTSGSQDGLVGTLTAAGKAAFPYLTGSVPIANDDPATAETFGVPATPVDPNTWTTLVAAPGGNGAYLGVYTHPDDGREEMVMTVNSNQFQIHDQLLRHGMLNWVTRGVFLGYQRNYLSLDVDDVFLPDDKWDAANNVTDYDPAVAIRMTPQDVDNAVAWENRTGLRLNLVYNMGGLTLFPDGAPALLAEFQRFKNSFSWTNHTFDHPNLDCSTAGYITSEITQNQAQFNSQIAPGLAAGLNNPSEVVTGEHSGLANTRPGNPGTIDPPEFDDLEPGTGGTLAAGTYDYGITATTPSGETPASVAETTVEASGSATLTWPSICHATSYKVYRRTGTTGAWSLLATVPPLPAATAFTDAGATDVTYTDNGAAGSAGSPPTANGAALAPYAQNPSFVAGITAAGIQTLAADASKAYPNPPTKSPVAETDPTNFPAGATFTDGPAQAVPRYPTNVYYNVANRADQLDEYNWIYVSPPTGNCQPITGVTTCRTAPATWSDYLTSESNIMFGHVMGNDPRPHYFHQTNLAQSSATAADTDTTVGGNMYAVVDTLLAKYDADIDRSVAPLIQLNQAAAAATLTQQATWKANASAGNVTAWLQDGLLHVKNNTGAAIAVPLTGTTVGDMYAGQRSGWTSVPGGSEQVFSPNDPANASAPTVAGSAKVGSTLSASNGTWSGTAPIDFTYQWLRCNSRGADCSNIAGAQAATYRVTSADGGSTLRAVVQAGNWVSSVSQATSAATGVVPKSGAAGGAGSKGGSKSKRLSLTKLKMNPRRFAVAHKRKRKGTRLDGSVITWRLNQAARVRLTFQRRGGHGKHRRWVTVGHITRSAKAGKGVVRFRGRFGRHLLKPQSYRLVVMATKGKRHSPHKHFAFRVVKG